MTNISFPTSLDTTAVLADGISAGDARTTASPATGVNASHHAQHNNLSDAVLALEAKAGITGSAVTSSLDYLVNSIYFNVKSATYGAIGDDSHDDTTAIQAALTAAGVFGGTVYFPPGTYKVTATLTCAKHVRLLGCGLGATILHRTTDYGDTLVMGTTAANAGAQGCGIKGIWFYYTAGTWTGTPRHIVLNHAQEANISECWFWGLDGGIYLDGGTKVNIHDNEFQNSGAAGSYDIKIVKGSVDASISTGITLRDNYFTAVGNARCIIVETVEVLDIVGGFIGGYVTNGIYFNAKTILSGVHINVPYFDTTNGGNTIEFAYSDTYSIDVTVEGSNFFGANTTVHHIKTNKNGTSPSVVNLNVTGNTFRDSTKASMNHLGTVGAVLSDNVFLNYNATHTSTTDPATVSGIYIAGGATGVSRNINCENNIFGATGSVDWATAGDTNNYAVYGVYTDSTGTSVNITITGNAGLFRTGGALYAGDVTEAWTAYTPSVSAQVGSITTSSAAGRYRQVGKTVNWSISVTVTTNGTGSGSLIATLPVAAHAVNENAFIGRNSVSGAAVLGYMISGASNLFMQTLTTAAYPVVDGDSIVISGSYEAA